MENIKSMKLYTHVERIENELAELGRDLYAITLPRIAQYRSDLEDAGFEVEHCDDVSADWAEFTRVRLGTYLPGRACASSAGARCGHGAGAGRFL